MFWKKLSPLILKNRVAWLVFIILTTVFMAFEASKMQLAYELAKILPMSDKNSILYEGFKARFGEDGNVMVVAIQSDKLYEKQLFNEWYDLNKKIKGIDGIKNVVSNANLSEIRVDDSLHRFKLVPLLKHRPETQAEIDTLQAKIKKMPFYRGLIYSESGNAHLLGATFDQVKLNSKSRIDIVNEITALADAFGAKNHIEMHYSGLPFVRTNFMSKVSFELALFMFLAFFITIAILYLFFRSIKSVAFAALVVLVSVIWSVGIIVVLGYKITILTGLIPPIIIVIGIPNAIFILNKYQEEYLKNKDQQEALSIAIEKISKTTFLANVTTSIGFFVFYFTGSPLLLEFGLVAAVCIMATWATSLILIPILESYSLPPEAKHVKHLDNQYVTSFLKKVDWLVHNRRTPIYWFILGLILISCYGMTRIQSIGYIVDDLPEKDPIFKDLKFIEKYFKGIVPFEVQIDTKKENGIMNPQVLNKIKLVEREFAKYPDFTSPISIVEAIKVVYQGYRGGDEKYYQLPNALEIQKLSEYVGDLKGKESQFASFVDSTKRYTRVSFQMNDAGSVRIKQLLTMLQPKVDSIFNFDRETNQWLPKDEQIDAKITGNGVVFMEGNDYLLKNLEESTLLAIVLVSMIMATLFRDFRMIAIATVPSVIPLIITAGILGFLHIPLKPTTTLVFSIAFGISSDGTIYFLTKYKDELVNHGRSVGEAVSNTIKYTGISMFYTAIILFFGFGIFTASSFKGTIYLGTLVSVTLLMGMIANLVLLPALLMTLDKRRSRAKS